MVCRNRVVSPISANKIGLFQFSIQPYVIIYFFKNFIIGVDVIMKYKSGQSNEKKVLSRSYQCVNRDCQKLCIYQYN